jgi:N-acetylmuramoyl-L-alanine amidase/putative methionine-R-sulfoxide reductase with GAF domain
MATSTTKPHLEIGPPRSGSSVSGWPRQNPASVSPLSDDVNDSNRKPSRLDALQALLAFSTLHEQIRRRRALAAQKSASDKAAGVSEFEDGEQFVLDEVLQLVAERAVSITGADGIAIALAENNEIVLRASAGAIKPDVGARIDRDSAFSGACFRNAQIVRCDDTETDDRVNVHACRLLGARSMVAVPLCGRRRVIGLLEAFSTEPFGFNDSDTRSLSLLAELILGALKPEDEDRFAESAQVAATKLDPGVGIKADRIAAADPAAKVGEKSVEKAAVEEAARQHSVATQTVASSAFIKRPTAPATKLFQQPVSRQEKIVKPAQATDTEPAMEELQPHHRPGVLLVLVLVVVASMLAGGLWWKLKNAQLGSAMVQQQSVAQGSAEKSAPAASEIGAKATPQGPVATGPNDNTTNASPDGNLTGTDGATESGNSAASPQELSKFPRVTGIRHWSSADSSTVVLDLEDQVQYEAHRLTGPNRIYFDLRDTALPAELSGKSIEIGDALLNRIRVAQTVPGMTRVVLETRGNSNFSVSLEPNPYRLVVQIRKIGAQPQGAVNLFPSISEVGKNLMAIVVPPPTKEDLQWRARVPKMRIAVDAGHGGWDLGTVGRRGLLEKDLVLEVAQRLGKLLESRLGADVIYTRQDDNYISLDERAGIANQAQADLFVSVHANYSDLPSARGVETYYTNFFSTPSTKDVETRENGIASNNPPIAALSPVELHERIEQSRRLAASVQRSLYGTLSVQNPGLRDRGIKEAGFVVLTETSMPGILAEISFVSSPTDEQRLRSDGYREQIAEALYKGIARYAVSSHGVKMASARKQ